MPLLQRSMSLRMLFQLNCFIRNKKADPKDRLFYLSYLLCKLMLSRRSTERELLPILLQGRSHGEGCFRSLRLVPCIV